MCLVVHFLHSLFVGSLYKTKYSFTFFVYPIGHAFTAVLFLMNQILLVRLSNVFGFHPGHNMYIHINRHGHFIRSSMKVNIFSLLCLLRKNFAPSLGVVSEFEKCLPTINA